MTELKLWRVGHRDGPIEPPPRSQATWNHRFDDPEKRFRTIYFNECELTAIREATADFRPSAAARRAFTETFGDIAEKELPTFHITASWRAARVLAEARVRTDGHIVNLADPAVRHQVEADYANLLEQYWFDHLDLSEVTSSHRDLTREIAAKLYATDAAGIHFPSRLDGHPALALFEDRNEICLEGTPSSLTGPLESLTEICSQWGLTLEPT